MWHEGTYIGDVRGGIDPYPVLQGALHHRVSEQHQVWVSVCWYGYVGVSLT